MNIESVTRLAHRRGGYLFVRCYVDPDTDAVTFKAQIEVQRANEWIVRHGYSTVSVDEAVMQAAERMWTKMPAPKKQAKKKLVRKT